MPNHSYYCGVYQIRNQINGKGYVGSSTNMAKRWQIHLSRLRRKIHCNAYLQNAFDKYGETAFEFSVLEEAKPEDLLEREQDYLDLLCPEYNLSPIAGSAMGCKRSLEARRKISDTMRGRTLSAEHRRRMSEARRGERNYNYGKHLSEETRSKIGVALRGRTLSEETRHKMSEAQRGRVFSKEHRRKLSEAHKGKSHSEETRRKMSESHRGMRNPFYGERHGEETLRKMREAKSGERHPQYGKSRSEETRRKISEGVKRYRAERRQITELEITLPP